MFPDLPQLRKAAAARIRGWGASRSVRLAAAALLVLFHLAVFTRAVHTRLAQPFNIDPEAPYFSDPDAPAFSEPRQPHHWSRLAVSRFDAQHYIATAERGLTACPHGGTGEEYLQCGLGWLPAWGTLGGAVSTVTTLATDKALVVLAILAALAINLLWTSKTMVKKLGLGAAWGAMIGFNAFPSAFYLVTPYSEAATLALALAGFVALAQERYWIAAAIVGASTALQPSSMAFALGMATALGYLAYTRKTWKLAALIPLVAWGQVATMLWLQISVGDWGAYIAARHAFGATYTWSRLLDVSNYMKALAGQDMDGAMLLATLALTALNAKDVVKRLAPPEILYVSVATFVAVVLAVVTPPHYWGETRILLSCLIAFMGLGMMARNYSLVFALWCGLSLAFLWHVDLCDYITQGNHAACPALGRIELAIPLTP